MAQGKKKNIHRENGEWVDAQFPVIMSASRSTDIPAFYADWFFHRLKVGYSAWTNPFNGVKSYVAYADTRFIVFWSKNPNPLLQHLDYLKERNIGCYIQHTLNDYEKGGVECGVPPLDERIDTFKRLVDTLGQGRVIWRFDPLILTDRIGIDDLLRKVENIGDQLRSYTEELVFSFADIAKYKKVKANLERSHVNYSEWTHEQMVEFAKQLVELNKTKGWNYALATCGEADLDGVKHNRCTDSALITRLAWNDKTLMDFMNVQIEEVPAPTLFGEPEFPQDAILLPNNHYFASVHKKRPWPASGLLLHGEQGHRPVRHLSAPVRILLRQHEQRNGVAEPETAQGQSIGRNDNDIMNMTIEQNTNYAYKVKYLENPTLDKVRNLAVQFMYELSYKDTLH